MKTLLHRNTGRIFFYAFIAIVVSLFASDFALHAAQPRPDWKTEWETTQRAAQKEGRLVVYGPPGVDQQKLYTEIFQQTFPKIKVNYTPGRMSEVMSRIMAEQRAGVRQADLVLGGSARLLGTLKEEGFLQPIRPALGLPQTVDPAAWVKRKT